jgi:polygalacturonase
MNIFLSTVIVLSCATGVNAQTFNIREFGAESDGKTVNTIAIQKTIDACRDNGGGMVEVPAGIFVSGTLHLYSNVLFHLESGAVLKASPRVEDYLFNGVRVGLFYTENSSNVSITGPGTIDLNGDVYMDFAKAKKIDSTGSKYTRQKEQFRFVESGLGDGPVVPLDRPYQEIIFSNCTHVTMRDLLIRNSPFWTVHIADCDGVVFSGIRIWNSLMVANADGVDFTSCSNVLVSDCDIRGGDDAIVITGYDHHFDLPGFKHIAHVSENVVVTNCHLVSRSSGIRIGGLDQNTMRNYVFSNIVIDNSNRGIGLFQRAEGCIEDMTFTNIVIKTRQHTGDWWGNGEPIHLSAMRVYDTTKIGVMKNIKFSHIVAEGESGLLVYGTEASEIENVSFDDVSFRLNHGPLTALCGGNIDLRPVAYPQFQLFSHDIPAFYAEHVKHLRLHDVDITWGGEVTESFFTNGIEIAKFTDVTIDGCTAAGAPHSRNAVGLALRDGNGYRLQNMNTNVTVSKKNVTTK